MLGKLIKYDLKSTSRILVIIHVFLILSALFMRFLITGRVEEDLFMASGGSDVFYTLLVMVYTLVIIGASSATCMVVAIRFYRHLFSDEGYLTNTLPVKRSTHLLAKTISGSLWLCIDMILIMLSLFLVAFPPVVLEMFRENQETVAKFFGFGAGSLPSLPAFLGLFLLVCVLSGISSVVTLYGSIALGQLFSEHRVIGAVACYFAITTITSVISYIAMAILGISGNYLAVADGTVLNLGEFLWKLILFSLVWSLILSVILYVVTTWVMNRKLNLP